MVPFNGFVAALLACFDVEEAADVARLYGAGDAGSERRSQDADVPQVVLLRARCQVRNDVRSVAIEHLVHRDHSGSTSIESVIEPADGSVPSLAKRSKRAA